MDLFPKQKTASNTGTACNASSLTFIDSLTSTSSSSLENYRKSNVTQCSCCFLILLPCISSATQLSLSPPSHHRTAEAPEEPKFGWTYRSGRCWWCAAWRSPTAASGSSPAAAPPEAWMHPKGNQRERFGSQSTENLTQGTKKGFRRAKKKIFKKPCQVLDWSLKAAREFAGHRAAGITPGSAVSHGRDSWVNFHCKSFINSALFWAV